MKKKHQSDIFHQMNYSKFSFEDTGKSLESPPEKMDMVTQNGTELDFTQGSLNE